MSTENSSMWKCAFCELVTESTEFKKGVCPRCGRRAMLPPKQQAAQAEAEELIPSDAIFFVDQFGDTFARVDINGHYEVHPTRSDAFKRIITGWLIDADGKPTSEKLRMLQLTCEAKAIRANKRYALFNRYAIRDGAVYVDLCNDEWEVARIDNTGYHILSSYEMEQPLFRRYAHMKPIIVIDGGTAEDLNKYTQLVNLKGDTLRLLYRVNLAVSMIPGIPHVIVTATGSQGSAKSTLFKTIRVPVDNSETLLLSLPTDRREFVQQLQHHYMPFYDNVDALTDWQSDTLCRASTGEGFSKRTLWTDDDDRIYKYQRCCGVNGINTPGTRADFLDRCLPFTMERIKRSDRLTEQELLKQYEDLSPRVVSYLWAVISQAISNVEIVRQELKGKLPRMADYAVYGEAVSRAMGNPANAFFDAYNDTINSQNIVAVSSSIVGSTLLVFLEVSTEYQKKGVLEISSADLYKNLKDLVVTKGYDPKIVKFPGGAQILTRRLRSIKANLAELGVNFEIQETATSNKYVFKNSSTTSTSSTNDGTSSGGESGDGATGSSNPAASRHKPNDDNGGAGANGANFNNLNTSSARGDEAQPSDSGTHLSEGSGTVAGSNSSPPGAGTSPAPEQSTNQPNIYTAIHREFPDGSGQHKKKQDIVDSLKQQGFPDDKITEAIDNLNRWGDIYCPTPDTVVLTKDYSVADDYT